MNIIDFGSYIDKGNYTLHTNFQNVHNYISEQGLVSLVVPAVGSGPNNIVLTEIPKKSYHKLTIDSTGIHFENRSISYKKAIITDESDLKISDYSHLKNKIDTIIAGLLSFVELKSLAFLLYPELENNFQSSFERAFLIHVKSAIKDINLSNLVEVAAKMKGVGFGLTPSGDDFNCGMLYALHYLSDINLADKDKIIEQLYKNSLGKNQISNTFLKFAYLNKQYEKFFNLLKAMKYDNDEEIINCAKRVLKAGHSSGSDMLTGFLFTLQKGLSERSSE